MFYCRGCEPSSGDGFDILKRFHRWTYKQAADEIDKIIGNLPTPKPKQQTIRWVDVAQLWCKLNPVVTDDPVGTYLRSRGISLAAWPKALRYARDWKHAPSGRFLPCMMALFRSPDGKLGTVHRTYLSPMPVTPTRMFLPGGIPKGGAIRLWPPDVCMGVAEGIETALSAALLYRLPVWACCTEGLLRAWQPPECCTHVTIFGDNDSSFVGQRAAYELAWRLARDGLHVKVEIPPTPDTDWNDALKATIETATDHLPELRMQHRNVDTGQPLPAA